MKNNKVRNFKKDVLKIDTGLAGVAGEFFVAAELSRRGYLSTLTQRNTKSVDILVSNSMATKSATIQVKTNQGYQTYWMLTNKSENLSQPRLFYVFVNLGTETGFPEYHIVPSKIVADTVRDGHAEWLNAPGKKGQARNDSSIRKFHIHDKKFLNKWSILDLD